MNAGAFFFPKASGGYQPTVSTGVPQPLGFGLSLSAAGVGRVQSLVIRDDNPNPPLILL
jgi:hypothetical protein